MLRLRTLLTRSLALAALSALCVFALAACGSQRATTKRAAATTAKASVIAKKTLYIYSGLPHNGSLSAQAHQIEQGIEFALAQAKHRVGAYQIKYEPLSDSTPPRSSRARSRKKRAPAAPSHGWNAVATVKSAETAARNPQTVAYVGDLNTGATELSLPILNQAGIVELTPGSGYPGLTDKVTGVTVTPGEPNRYYPQSRPSLLRLVPNDIMEAAAIVSWLKKYPTCHTVAAASFGTGKSPSTESTALIAAIDQTAKLYGLGYMPVSSPGNNPKNYEPYVAGFGGKVTCFVLTGHVTRAAIAFTNELKAKLPLGSVIVGTNSFCNAGWSDQARGGASAEVDPVLYCTTPVIPLDYYPNGKSFRSLYQRFEHRTPTAYTYYGYLAATLILQAISDIGNLDSRKQVMFNLVTNGPSTDLQTYTFDSNGDLSGTAANYYGLDKIHNGIPTYDKVLEPRKWLPSEA